MKITVELELEHEDGPECDAASIRDELENEFQGWGLTIEQDEDTEDESNYHIKSITLVPEPAQNVTGNATTA